MMSTTPFYNLWNNTVIRALVYVALVLACYLFGEFSVPFIYRDF